MLIVKLQINSRVVRTIGILGIHNIHPDPIDNTFSGECPYDVYEINYHHPPLLLGSLKHTRSDGAEILARNALDLVLDYDKQKIKLG